MVKFQNLRKNMLLGFILAIVSVMLISCVYLILTILLYIKEVHFTTPPPQSIYLSHPFLTAVFKPNLVYKANNYPIINKDGELSDEAPHSLITNSLGFRDDEFSKLKSNTTLRICAFGGSVLVSGSSNNATMPSMLEDILKENKVDAEVLNFGSPGWWSRQELFVYLTSASDYSCDMLWIHDGRNDAYTAAMPNYKAHFDSWDEHHMGILENYQSNEDKVNKYFHVAKRLYNRIFSDKNTTDITNMTAEMICTIKYQKSKGTSCSDQYKFKDKQISVYENNLDAIISLASIDGIKIVLSTQPSLLWGKPNKINAEKKILSTLSPEYIHSMNMYRPLLVEVGKNLSNKHGICYIDFTSVFKEETGYIYLDDVHHNDRGNRIIANKVANTISNIKNNDRCFR